MKITFIQCPHNKNRDFYISCQHLQTLTIHLNPLHTKQSSITWLFRESAVIHRPTENEMGTRWGRIESQQQQRQQQQPVFYIVVSRYRIHHDRPHGCFTIRRRLTHTSVGLLQTVQINKQTVLKVVSQDHSGKRFLIPVHCEHLFGIIYNLLRHRR